MSLSSHRFFFGIVIAFSVLARSTAAALCVAWVTMVHPHSVLGQNPAPNVQYTNKAIDLGLRGNLTVNPSTRAVEIQIPLGSYPGRAGHDVPITISYSSKVHNIKYHAYNPGHYNSIGVPVGDGYTMVVDRFAEHSSAGWTSSTGFPVRDYSSQGEKYNVFGTAVGNDGECSGGVGLPCLTIDRLLFRMPDGSTHELRSTDQPRQAFDPLLDNYYSVDGSRMRYQRSTDTLFMADGSRYLLGDGKYIDRNGNTISNTDTLGRPIVNPPLLSTTGDYPYSLPGVSGSVNYTFKWRYLDDPGVLTSPQPLKYVAESACPYGTGSYSPNLFSSYSPNRTCILNGGSIFRPVVLYQIVLPTGQAYTFTYNIYGEIDKVVLPTGGYERYDYAQVGSLSDMQPPYAQSNRGVIRRYLSASGSPADELPPWQYSVGGASVEITNPDGSLMALSMYSDPSLSGAFGYSLDQPRAGRTFSENVYSPPDGNGVRQLLRRHLNEWSVTGSNASGQYSTAQNATRNARLTKEVEIIFSTVGPALARTTTHEYDLAYQFSTGVNQTATTDYDYVALDPTTAQTIDVGSVPTGTLLRRTEKTSVDATNQAYRDRNLLGLVTSVTVKDGLNNVLAQSSIVYDEGGQYAQLNDYGSVTNWTDPQTTYRGNPTTTSKWLNFNGSNLSTFPNGTYLTTHAQYDQCGSVRSLWDAKGNLSQIEYSSSFAYAYPTVSRSSVPDSSGIYGSTAPLISTSSYDLNTGKVIWTTDANNKTTNFDYSDQLNRLRQVTMPDTARVRYNYFDAPGDLYVQVLTDEDSARSIETRKYFDGLGRPTRDFLFDGTPSTPWSVTDTYYDYLGRASQVSNPYRVSSPSANVAPTCSGCTTNAYDALGRVVSVTTPDSAQVTTSYGTLTSGSTRATTVLVTDQAGKKRRSLTDSLGRLVRVDEPDVNGNLSDVSSPVQPTTYSYDLLGNLRLVTQGAQQRFFMYDSLSRLLRARNPELAVNPNLPAFTDPITGNGQWSTGYTYDHNGNLTQKIDARGVVSSYAYDALNRNKTIDYSDTTGVNPDVTRVYDGATNGKGYLWESYAGGSAAIGNNVEHTRITGYDALGRPLSQLQEFKANGVWTSAYTIQRLYNLAGKVTWQIYPSGRSVGYSYDTAGRLNSFTGYLGDGFERIYSSEIIYSPLGGMTKEKFGTDTALYNKLFYNSRGQLAEIRLGAYHATDGTWWNRGAIINHYSNSCWGMCGGSNSSTHMTDNNGNLKKQDVYIPGNDQITSYTMWTDQFDYDSLNRLQRVREYTGSTPSDWQQEYVYDRYGNRTLHQTNTYGSGINKKTFTVNTANNRLGVPDGQAGTMTYDNAGNLTTDTYSGAGATRAYDAENRMTSETQAGGYLAGLYTYNADGQRVRRKVGGVETWQVYGFEGELLAEYAANAAPANPQKEYGYRNGQLLVTAEASVRTNVARASNGATATAQNYTQDSVYPGSHFQPAYAIDGTRYTTTNGDQYWRDEHGLPSWMQIDFNGSQTIDEIDVFTMADAYQTQDNPSATQTFTGFGATAFEVQYWTGSAWATLPGGSVSGNNLVWKKINFTAVTTSKIRVVANAAVDGVARIVEVEAWGTAAPVSAVNVARASNGATATAQNYTQDSVYPGSHFQPAYAIDGTRYTTTNGDQYWRDEHGLPSWLQIDFNGSKTIEEIDVFTMADAYQTQANPSATQTFTGFGTTAFEVQYWTGSAWATVSGGSVTGNSLVWKKITFTAIATSKIRVVANAAVDGVARIVEVEAWTVAASGSSANINWLVADQLGTPRMVVDKTGSLTTTKRHDYLPFGEELFANQGKRITTLGYSGDAIRQKFTSKERDIETGLDFFGARYHASAQGRFTSVDPILLKKTRLLDPQRINLYAYVRNNPLKYIDPNGEDITIAVTAVVTGQGTVSCQRNGEGPRVREVVYTYRMTVTNSSGTTREFSVTRDTNYNGPAAETRGDYGTNSEAPPGEYRGHIRNEPGHRLGWRIEVYDPDVRQLGDRNTINAPDGTARENIQIHKGPGCSKGCVVLQEGVANFRTAVTNMQAEDQRNGRGTDIYVNIEDRNGPNGDLPNGDRINVPQVNNDMIVVPVGPPRPPTPPEPRRRP